MDKLRSDITGFGLGIGGIVVSIINNPQKLILWLTAISLTVNILLGLKRLFKGSKQ